MHKGSPARSVGELSVSKKVSLRASAHTGVAIPYGFRKPYGIATPVCGLVRDDVLFFGGSSCFAFVGIQHFRDDRKGRPYAEVVRPSPFCIMHSTFCIPPLLSRYTFHTKW